MNVRKYWHAMHAKYRYEKKSVLEISKENLKAYPQINKDPLFTI